MRAIRIVAIICLFAARGVALELATTYEKALAIANAQESAPETKDYFANTLLPYYAKTYSSVMQSCFAKTAKADTRPFSFVAVIDSSGSVLHIYSHGETNLFLCLRQSLKEEVFPQPPVSPYYLHIDMQFGGEPKPQSPAQSDNAAGNEPPLVVSPDKYSYTFGVPGGWDFSFEQAHARGANLAFFPKSGDFNTAESVIYTNEIDDGCATNCLKLVDERVASTVEDVKKDSPRAEAAPGPAIATKDGGKAVIRLIKGSRDPRNPELGSDNEALAVIGHDETIILVVLSVRNPSTWDRDYAAFQQVVAGHRFFNCATPGLRVPCKR